MRKSAIIVIAVATAAAVSARASDASALYEKECTKCHGADGKGETKMGKKLGAKDYSDPKVQEALKDESGFKAIKDGLKRDDKTLMKPLEGATDDQIAGLVAYMRTFRK